MSEFMDYGNTKNNPVCTKNVPSLQSGEVCHNTEEEEWQANQLLQVAVGRSEVFRSFSHYLQAQSQGHQHHWLHGGDA